MMQTMKLGRTGPAVSALGLGCMGMSPGVYGPADDVESIATIHAALDAGINFLDTGDFYGMGHNEMLIRRALDGVPRDRVAISVKFGALRDPAGMFVGNDSRPAAVKNRAGYIRHVGLSEVGAETIRRAQAVHPIADLQIEYSLMSRGIEKAILPTTRELGIGITAYGVLSRGLLSGRLPPAGNKGDMRLVRMPRFQQGNVEQNLQLVEALRQIGGEKGASPAQLALAWVRSRGDDILPVMGARRRDQLKESLDSLDLKLSADDLARIDAAVSPELTAGTRYDAPQMAHLDSEGHA
jgi:aryl-alcohol dehydrogenase-like predicted oxidoreductase